MTGRNIGPNLQRRNAETEAETEAGTEAEIDTDTEERNGNTEDRVLVQGETSYVQKDGERVRKKKKERQTERESSKIRER